MREIIFNWLTYGTIKITKPNKKEIRYWIVDLFGNEYQVSKLEFYIYKALAWIFLATMALAVIFTILISIWSFI